MSLAARWAKSLDAVWTASKVLRHDADALGHILRRMSSVTPRLHSELLAFSIPFIVLAGCGGRSSLDIGTEAQAAGGSVNGDGGEPVVNDCTGPGPTNPAGVTGFVTQTAYVVAVSGEWFGWGVNYGVLTVEQDLGATVLYHAPPSEGATSYFLAPTVVLGDLSKKRAVVFELKSRGGDYYDAGYAYLGDVVLMGAGLTAFSEISHTHDGAWHDYSVPLDPELNCWSVEPAALQKILSDVTGLAIRAEYGVGEDETWLAHFEIQ